MDDAHLLSYASHYTLRLSRKAKYLQLRISARGLEVIVPAKKPPRKECIEEFLRQKKAWIEKNLARCSSDATQKEMAQLPRQIHLPAFRESWDVFYVPTQQTRIRAMTNLDNQIHLLGPVHEHRLCVYALQNWLKNKAQAYLSVELSQLAQATGFTFTQMTVRNNNTRWGSCSSKKRINLCCKLILLPSHLVRHILLHELCHTKVMHHGKKFWDLLVKYDPKARDHVKELKSVALHVPGWACERINKIKNG